MAALAKSKDFGTGGTANTGGNWPHSGKATPLNTGHLTPADRHGSVQVRYYGKIWIMTDCFNYLFSVRSLFHNVI